MGDEVWRLHHDGRPVAELHVDGQDMPWQNGRVVALPGFEEIAPLFAEEVRLVEEIRDIETPEWAAAYDQIRRETRMTFPDGREVPEYLLHIDGDRAWWRWHDQRFD